MLKAELIDKTGTVKIKERNKSMNLIFHNGEKLYQKESKILNDCSDFLQKLTGIKLYPYQEIILNQMFKQNQSDFSIYGDDFKIEIIPTNVIGHCVLIIKDYDEKQKFESEITIDFTKDELDQFINLLQIAKNKMK